MTAADGSGRSGLCFVEVSLVLDGATILDRVSLELAEAGVTVIAGPSGSGKSTLLRMGNRLEVPTSGSVSLDGVDLDVLDPRVLRRRVGMVFQRPVTFAGTVRENLQVAEADAGDDACTDCLGRAGLSATFLDRQADDLSGGEAQRLCVARALMTNPQILLMDEATSSLDVDSRLTVEKLARDLADGGTPVVWVTHDLDQADRLGDQLIVMLEGRVAAPAEAERCLRARSFEPADDPWPEHGASRPDN